MRILLVAPEGRELPSTGALEVQRAETVAEAAQRLEEEFAAVILDLSVLGPGSDEPAAQLMRAVPVLLWGPEGPRALDLLRAGAQDVLPPTAGPDELRRSLQFAAARHEGQSARREAMERELENATPPEPHLRECQAQVFQRFVAEYEALLDQALQRRGYSVPAGGSPLPEMAQKLRDLGATPRDAVEIHTAAVRARSAQAPRRGPAYVEEGRLLVLQLMGHLAAAYRERQRP